MSLAKFGQSIIKTVVNNKFKIINKIVELILKKFPISPEISSKIQTAISIGNISDPQIVNELTSQLKSYAIEQAKKQKVDINVKSFCPTTDELLKIIKVRNQLLQVLTNIKKQTNLLDKTTKPLNPIITSLALAIKILKTLPLPSATSGVGLPMGFILTASNSLSVAQEKVNSLKSNINSLEKIKEFINKTIDQISSLLKLLDVLIEFCAKENAQIQSAIGGNIFDINNSLNSEDNNLIDNLQDSDSNENNTYNGFKFEILMDTNNDTRFPKRYAVAKTPSGIIMLRGESSFSSSVEVLINELKFIIDRDNLKI